MKCIKNISGLLFLLSFYACSQNKYNEALVGKNGLFWDVIQSGDRRFNTPRYSYFFDINGVCIYYTYMKYPNMPVKRVKFDYGDVVYPNTWQLISDTLQIQGFKHKIVSFTQDKIILIESNTSKDTLMLKRSNFIE
jgi:hypothetical protein